MTLALNRRVEEMRLAPGTKLGRYEIRSKIGAGGMGLVIGARRVYTRFRFVVEYDSR